MTQCCAPHCKNQGRHIFPKDPKRRKSWEKALRIKNFKATKHSVLCSAHFTADDYFGQSKYTAYEPRAKFLKKTAVPSIFSFTKLKVESVSAIQHLERLERRSQKKLMLDVSTRPQESNETCSSLSVDIESCKEVEITAESEENHQPTSADSVFVSKGVKTSIIYPATEKHIAKFSQQETHIVLETPELYEKLTLPHITKEQFNLQWVYNILEGKSEQGRVIYDNKCERDGFVLLPDLKWDGLTKETLYLLAIVRRRGIKSLRDLDETSLPLLKRIRDEGKKKIYEKYKVPASQLRVYLHYQPSFYHLHVHFTYLRHEAPGIYAEKSHLLDTVIDNIEMIGDYYKKATLPFTIREMDNIFNIYETNGHVQRIKPNIENIELIDK